MITELEKMKARRTVRTARSQGVLTKPSFCERCGKNDMPASDGRSTLHAHHHDYAKPLDVEWICAKCHRDETPLPPKIGRPNYGEKNGFSKLKECQIQEILSSKLSGVKLGKKFGVDQSTVNRVRSGQRWLSVTKAAAKLGA